MLRVRQAPRALPLVPGAVLGLGPAARSLALRLLKQESHQLGRLRGLAGTDFLLLLGEPDDLPWVDGLTYLGREPSAPELYLPCATTPDVPAPLLLRALLQRFHAERPSVPLAVSLEPQLVVSCAAAQPLSREPIVGWLTREHAG